MQRYGCFQDGLHKALFGPAASLNPGVKVELRFALASLILLVDVELRP